MDLLTRRGFLAMAILLTFLPLRMFAQDAKDKPAKDKPGQEKIVDAPVDPAKVAPQKAAALANWKRIVEDAPQLLETANLLIVAPSATKTLSQTGASLEKAYAVAYKALKLSRDELWPGKMTVYLVPERAQYQSFMRSVIRRRAEEDDRGGFLNEGDLPTVVAGPPVNERDFKVEQEAVSQISQALLTQKAKVKVPDWLVLGFGRATVFRVGSQTAHSREKQRALALLIKNKRTSRDVWMGSEALLIDEAAILRGSLVEFLAYGGVTHRFADFVTGYRMRDKKILNPTTQTAFTRADINAETLEQGWRVWLASR
jgi:hypothetical protein